MNKIKEALKNREVTIGTWIQSGNPTIAEVLAETDFEWIAADCEHTDIEIGKYTQVIRSMYGRGVVPFARVRENDTLAIRQVLDMGAQGIIVPLVNNAEEARRAVLAATYPPKGIRGFSFARANRWGLDFDEYAKNANDDICVIVMIESKEAVDNIDEILSVEGIDGIFVGPYDMSGSYGVTGQTDHPMMVEACERVAQACKHHKKSAGMHILFPTEQAIRKALNDGYTFLALSIDILFMREQANKTVKLFKDIVK